MPGRGHGDQGPRGDDDFSRAKRMLQGLKRQEEPEPGEPPAAAAAPPSGEVLSQLVSALKQSPGKLPAVEPSGYGYLLRVRDREEPIGPGARGDAVVALQVALRKVGITVPDTGRFDAPTEEAVRAFQRVKGVPETGSFDPPTFAALHTALGLDEAPEAPEPEPPPRSGSGVAALPPTGNPYMDALAPGAVRGMHESGVPASVLLAMAILESDWGQTLLARDHNNVFGLPGSGPDGSVMLQDRGGGVLEPSGSGTLYRQYRDPADSVADFARAFAAAKDYEGVMTHRGHPEHFARALVGSYSANPNYGSLVIRIMGQFDLARFDRIPPPKPQGW